MRVACYYRVSTSEQSIESQRDECQRKAKQFAGKAGEVVEFSDVASATKRNRHGTRYSSNRPANRDTRPKLTAMIHECESGKIDRVVIVEVSRLARDVAEGAELLKKFARCGAPIYFVRGAHDTDTKHGMMGALYELVSAEIEAVWISERTRAGMKRSKKQLGRRTVVSEVDLRTLVDLRDKGASWGEIHEKIGLPLTTIRRAYAKRSTDANTSRNGRRRKANRSG